MAENTILIDINVSSDQLAESNKRILELSNSIADLKKKRDDLKKAGMLTAEAEADISRKLREQNAELKNNVNLVNSSAGSPNQMKAQVSLGNAERNKMTAAEREGTEEGRRLTAVSKELTDRLKEKEEQVGITTRKVGSYKTEIREL